MTAVGKMMQDDTGSIIISVILGFGLAAIFRRACTGDRCIVVKAPKIDDVNKFVYKVDQDCFKYSPYVVPCDDK